VSGYEKIVGVGLNKTGTKTLAECFWILGFGRHLSVRGDLLALYRRGLSERVLDIMEEYNTFEDWPYPLMYQEIFNRFGRRARYILTKRRNDEIWLNSLKHHSLRTPPERHCRLLAYGYSYPHGLEEIHKKSYNDHNRDVVEFFKSRDALDCLLEVCWETGDGWSELCTFLELPLPNLPFPQVNVGSTPIPADVMAHNQQLIAHQLRLLYDDAV